MVKGIKCINVILPRVVLRALYRRGWVDEWQEIKKENK